MGNIQALQITITQNWLLVLVGLLGMISHFLKKYQANQTSMTAYNPLIGMFKYYFEVDVINTLLTFIAFAVMLIVMKQMNETSIFGIFSSGYMCDSLFNKAEERGLKL